jgi:hypothetical protein
MTVSKVKVPKSWLSASKEGIVVDSREVGSEAALRHNTRPSVPLETAQSEEGRG